MFVDVEFDQPRRLLIDLRASKALDRAMGEVGIAEVLAKLRALNFSTLERTLWAGLLHEEPTLTVNLVAKRLEHYEKSGKSMVPLFSAAIAAVNESELFKTEELEGNPQPEPARV